MKKESYIIGKALYTSLGNTKEKITEEIYKLSQDNYLSFLENKFKEKAFYKIEERFDSEKEKFFKILKEVIDQSINESQIKDKENLHIFIGSTSMGISIEEEANQEFHNNKNIDELSHIGYGYIGTFVEEYIKSKYKSIIFSTACTSSTNAIAYASKLIQNNKIKKAIIIGIELFNRSTFDGFSSLMLLSQNKVYRPFDEKSDGIILGEACSAVILDSVKNKDSDFKYISSSNICDNYSETTSNPSGEPILNCMNSSIQNAGMTLKNIDLIKAHATGSENNNSSEAKAINDLFNNYQSTTNITAVKPYIGHTLGACGTNEIVLILYCIEKGFFPATLGFEKSEEKLEFTPLLKHKNNIQKTTVLFNFVAFGGNNSSIILSNKSENVYS
ncbi:beta-ketoacyl synthase [Poseidonibacter lekithochrous]|uniref:beta-ketoacyl synthase N-terminal-like domain-containing protein n=1 Tax=Poseidonibacter TaxID=2321187 RepID=UPI001C080087|nr:MULTISPECIES: beta-ketoacyl synthase N-terminal-like domain-containing protein [Poseidonibacter]MBU3014474.1 beta-ketoacyl synthase [Poseidonibacter lekithochrous]MDO6827772.1 beta-ketoacyl synthase N-terminal-like domain-containing protein [Poseidonibacter sp. 1_MG-2023]